MIKVDRWRARFLAAVLILLATVSIGAQTRRPARRPAPAPLPAKTEPAQLQCPAVLGTGVRTGRMFCDVLTGRNPADGIIIPVPPHTGPATLTFTVHNRHTYSEELIKTNRAYRRYTATIGVLTADNTLLTRAVVENEFRSAADLVDRISGGAAPGGLKAVAPTGSETIVVTIPAAEESVSILGEKLSVLRLDGTDTFIAPGRPIAVISGAMLEYHPARPAAPARRTTTRTPTRR